MHKYQRACARYIANLGTKNDTGNILGVEIFTGKNLGAEICTGKNLGAEIGDLSGAGALIFVHISNSNKTCNNASICLKFLP